MCGKRLKLWKTMPTSRRSASTSMPRPLTRSPPRWISPLSTVSSWLMHRNSVDLPLPDAPIRQTTWCRSTSRSMPRSTGFVPNDLQTSRSTRNVMRSPGRQGLGLLPLDQPVEPTCERDRDEEEQNGAHRIGGQRAARVVDEPRPADHVEHAECVDQRRVLLQADEVVEQRRD